MRYWVSGFLTCWFGVLLFAMGAGIAGAFQDQISWSAALGLVVFFGFAVLFVAGLKALSHGDMEWLSDHIAKALIV